MAIGLEKVNFHSNPKERQSQRCSNYNIITLISHASTIMLKILQARLQQYVNQEFPDVQARFRKGRETRDQIANICRIIDKAVAAAAAKSLQSCLTLCDSIDGSPSGSPYPWDSPGKNSGVGRHLLLQCMKVKSASEVAQSCSTHSDLMDCSLPGSSAHGIFPGKSTVLN